MTNLLQTTNGRAAALVAKNFLLQRRMSRFFKSRLPIAVEQYETTGIFDMATFLGALNEGHDPEILTLFELLGLSGALGVTVQDMSIYVDALGSDETGDGSAAKPFGSLWFFDYLPKRVNHKIEIVISGTVVDGSFDLMFDHTFSGDGSINFIGDGAPTQIAGPFTVSAVTAFAGGIAGTKIDSNIGAGAPYAGKFVEAIDGADAHVCAVIDHIKAGSTVIHTGPAIFNAIAAPDQIRVIEPTPILQIRSLYGYARGEKKAWNFTYRRNRIVFMNMKLVLSSQQESEDRFVWENQCHTQFSFVQLQLLSMGTIKLTLSGYVNDGSSISTTAEALTNSGLLNLNDAMTGSHSTQVGLASISLGGLYTRGESKIKRVAHPQKWYVERASSEFEYCFASSFLCFHSNAKFSNCLAIGFSVLAAPHNGGGFIASNSRMYCNLCSTFGTDNMFVFIENSSGVIYQTDLDVPFTTARYCIYCEGLAKVEVIGDETNLNALPSQNAICMQGYNDPGAPGAPWEDPYAITAVDGAAYGGALPGDGPVVQHTRLA